MQKQTVITVVILLIVLVGLFAIFSSGTDDTMQGAYLNEMDKKVDLKNYESEDVNLSDFEGTPLVINSWAVWCPFCVEELKDFAKAKNQLEGDFEIIAVNRSEPEDKTKKFIRDLGIEDDLIFLIDSNDSFYKAIGGFSMPETIFVNEMGEVVFHKRGPMDLVEIKNKVNKLLLQ